MASDLTPDEVNSRLLKVSGYAAPKDAPTQKNLVIWSKINEAIPTLSNATRYNSYDNDKVKAAIDKSGFCLVEVDGARIGASRHWCLYIGGGQMYDPWFGTQKATSYYPTVGFSVIDKLVPTTPATDKELAECNIHKTNLQNQVNGLLKDIEAQKGVISDTETKLGTANGRIQELTKQNEDLSQQLGAIRGELSSAIQKIDTQNKVISSYVNEDAVQLETLKRLERENYDTKTLLGGLLSHFAQELKVSLGSESQEDAISKVIDAFDAFYSSSSSANDKIKSLESEVKKLTTQSRHISKLSIRDCIIILIDKLKEKYGKK